MKSQVGLEFLVGVLILLVIYAITIYAYDIYFKAPLIRTEYGKQACYLVSESIDSAVIGQDGFVTNASLPYQIDSSEYQVMISNVTESNTSIVTIDWDNGLFACSLSTQNVSSMTFKPCRYSVINLDGAIYLGAVWTDKLQYALNETVYINGSYYIGNVSVKIYFPNNTLVSGYPKTIPVENNSFWDMWTPTIAGRYLIYAEDTIYKNLNSERYIEII